MIMSYHNNKQYSFQFLSLTEQDALAHLFDLHAQVMQLKAMSRKLAGLLSANPYRNKAEEKAAHLREEVRKWHDIRRQATHIRHAEAI